MTTEFYLDYQNKMAQKPPILKGMTGGETLHKFIDRKIRPDTKYLDRCNEIIDKFVRHLEKRDGALVTEIDGKKINVKRVLKSGSLGKGTAVREMSDIDLIIFLNGFGNVKELTDEMPAMLRRIKSYVERDATWAKELEFKEMTPFSVQFYLKVKDDDQLHEVDLLPAVDITETLSKGAIYEEMKDMEKIRGAYSASLSPFQKQFVTSVPAKVKDLIRLLKYWAKVEDVPVRSYFLELLVIAHWRGDHKPHNFDMNIYFRDVMTQLNDLKSLGVAFDDNYNCRLYNSSLRKPYLLDPANPYRNVAPSLGDVPVVASKAKSVLQRL